MNAIQLRDKTDIKEFSNYSKVIYYYISSGWGAGEGCLVGISENIVHLYSLSHDSDFYGYDLEDYDVYSVNSFIEKFKNSKVHEANIAKYLEENF